MDSVELFFNGVSQGMQDINHKNGKEPFGYWQIEYHKGEIKAVAYDEDGNIVAEEVKKSFGDPTKIILVPETEKYGNLYFIQIMTADKDGTLVENARNYITIKVTGDAELVGTDNGDSSDYDEYKSKDGIIHSRRLFSNRLLAIVCAKSENSTFEVTAASKDLPNASIRYSDKKWCGVSSDSSIKPEIDFVPTRKIEIIADGATKMNKDNLSIKVTAKVLPSNATLKEVNWNPVLKECVKSDYISVNDLEKKEEGSGIETKLIQAEADGECILRLTARNGTQLDEIISDLPFSETGLGTKNLNTYELIEAIRYTNWDQTKTKPPITRESGISTNDIGDTWISFDKVDFGKDGSDTIHIPIFTWNSPLKLEIFDGNGIDGECLGKFTYEHEPVYNVYSENIFTLTRRIFGVHTVTIRLIQGCDFLGFYMDKSPKAFAKLRALDANLITGDSFKKTEEAVEGIGNNVVIDFTDMNFGEKTATKITICGKSNTENNTINIKFLDKNGGSTTQIIEFAHTDAYEEKTFDIQSVTGDKKVDFVFLPGCNFDFKWFKFE